VAEALGAIGADPTIQVVVVEGPDQGSVLALTEEERPYVVGRAAECDLPLADADASREHTQFIRRGGTVFVRDMKAKNGSWLGEARIPEDRELPWRPTQMVHLGRTVLALREPVSEALARIEGAADEPLPPGEAVVSPTAAAPPPAAESAPASAAPVVDLPPPVKATPKRRAGFSGFDLLVIAVGLGVLALSIASLVWLLKG
jgi:predicted component of type VI protein secretion system